MASESKLSHLVGLGSILSFLNVRCPWALSVFLIASCLLYFVIYVGIFFLPFLLLWLSSWCSMLINKNLIEFKLGHLPEEQNCCRVMRNSSYLEGPTFKSHVGDLPNWLRSLATCVIAGTTQQRRWRPVPFTFLAPHYSLVIIDSTSTNFIYWNVLQLNPKLIGIFCESAHIPI
jgi:hypothetical protein